MTDRPEVRVLDPDAAPEVASVLAESFFDYPVMRFVLGTGDGYARRLDALVGFFVAARVLRDEVLLGVGEGDGLRAAALVSFPERRSPPELAELRDRTWAGLGAAERRRYETFGQATSGLDPGRPHIHLNMIGVRSAARGTGLGRAMLDTVHRMSATDPSSEGVSLTTEVQGNVGLYRRFGYEVIGSARVGSAFTTWGMFRRDR